MQGLFSSHFFLISKESLVLKQKVSIRHAPKTMYKNVQVSIQEEIHFDVVVRVTRVCILFEISELYFDHLNHCRFTDFKKFIL